MSTTTKIVKVFELTNPHTYVFSIDMGIWTLFMYRTYYLTINFLPFWM